MTNTSPNATGASQGDQTGSPQAQGADSKSQGDQSTPEALQQQLADAKAKLALLEEEAFKSREKARLKKQQDEAAEAERQAQLKERGEYKVLAEQHAARLKEVEPLAQGYNQLASLISGQIEAQIKDWPQEVRALVPDVNTPIEQRLEQVEKLRPLVAKMAEQQRGQQPGNGPNPAQANPAQTREQQVADLKRRRVQSGMYGL